MQLLSCRSCVFSSSERTHCSKTFCREEVGRQRRKTELIQLHGLGPGQRLVANRQVEAQPFSLTNPVPDSASEVRLEAFHP